MSNILQIYRSHVLELLYDSPSFVPQSLPNGPKGSEIAYIDANVISQSHPAFSLYLLMSDPNTPIGAMTNKPKKPTWTS